MIFLIVRGYPYGLDHLGSGAVRSRDGTTATVPLLLGHGDGEAPVDADGAVDMDETQQPDGLVPSLLLRR
jgi:hypothetical protein